MVSSSSLVSSTSSSSMPSSYTISGLCIDNGNGSFYPQAYGLSSSLNITCSGSINYTNGTISGFSVNLPSTLTVSSTYSSITNSSFTASSTTIIVSSTTSLETLTNGYLNQNIGINYTASNGSTTGNTFYTYLPPPATAVYSLYYVPSSIIVGSTTIPCSQSTCQITNTPNGYLMQIQNIPLSGTSVSAVVSEYMTFNPSITVPTHQTASTIPYTFYITVTLPDGDTMSTSFSSAITVQSP